MSHTLCIDIVQILNVYTGIYVISHIGIDNTFL